MRVPLEFYPFPLSLSMLELFQVVSLNYEMLESRCINVPKSSIKWQAMLQLSSSVFRTLK